MVVLSDIAVVRFLATAVVKLEFKTAAPGRYIAIENRKNVDDVASWAITNGTAVWTTEGAWEWEPQPSSRTEEFFKRARYGSLEGAVEELGKAQAEIKVQYEETMARLKKKQEGL